MLVEHIAPNMRQAIKCGYDLLLSDGEYVVPSSRWGGDTSECAVTALAWILFHEDDPSEIVPEYLDAIMYLAVNDSDDMAGFSSMGRYADYNAEVERIVGLR